MTAADQKVRKMPKGGRKGGAVFPRTSLHESLSYARKLVNKTHIGPQAEDIILSGVVGSKTGAGRIRMSSLKQYGFLTGDVKTKFSANELARKIAAAPEEELIQLYRIAILKPTVFRRIFETFHGDTVTTSKLKQRAAECNVHPEQTETCIKLYLSGMVMAGLVKVDGDKITHLSSSDASVASTNPAKDGDVPPEPSEELVSDDSLQENSESETSMEGGAGNNKSEKVNPELSSAAQLIPRAVFNVNVTLDSSMDIEKLHRQLELLKRFGAI